MYNCDTVALIETKHKVRKEDVDELLIQKADNFRKLFPTYKDCKIVLGVSGMSFEKGTEMEAEKMV